MLLCPIVLAGECIANYFVVCGIEAWSSWSVENGRGGIWQRWDSGQFDLPWYYPVSFSFRPPPPTYPQHKTLTSVKSTPLLENSIKMGSAYDKMLDRIPISRFGKPEEIAQAVVFLASTRASFVTGEEILVDGGMLHTM